MREEGKVLSLRVTPGSRAWKGGTLRQGQRGERGSRGAAFEEALFCGERGRRPQRAEAKGDQANKHEFCFSRFTGLRGFLH